MIRCGVLDHSEEGKVWDSSTRAMRHGTIIGDCLWSLIEKEQDKVSSSFLLFLGRRKAEEYSRVINWSVNCTM